MKNILLFAVSAVSFFFAMPAFSEFSERHLLTQAQEFAMDFDDNNVATDAAIMIWDPLKNTEVAISTANWALVKDKIGKEEPWKRFQLRPESFREFTDTTPDGIEIIRKQVARVVAQGGDRWMGLSLPAYIEAMSHEETRKSTVIITARLNSPEAVHNGLLELVHLGIAAAAPDLENIYPVAWPGLPEQFKGANSAESKAKVMIYRLDKIEARPVPGDATSVTNREGTRREKLHLWGFSDDDYGNYSKAREVLAREVAKGRWPHLKIVLFFTGENNPDQRPRSEVIQSDGTVRPTLPVEATRMIPPRAIMSREQAIRAYEALVKNVCGDSLLTPKP